tara:strand:+ start:136 stop:390 length:255 start_codon:yes stop_codon:yes gene_type:complete
VQHQLTDLTSQGDIMKIKNKLFNNKYLKELRELEEQQEEILDNNIITNDSLDELDSIDVQKFCSEQNGYESLDSLDSNFDYMEI